MADPLAPGAPLPAVTLQGPDGPTTLDILRAGKPLIVIFYVEDQTPTCTAQLGQFRDEFPLIEDLGAAVVGISADGIDAHAAFRHAQRLPFPLLADPDLAAARAFGIADDEAKRARRAVFVADAQGRIVAALPHYSPLRGEQFVAVFAALGADL